MGSNAIRKDEAIETTRKLTAKTIERLEISVEKLNKELAETKDRLVNAQTIDLQVQTQENAQKKQLQAELSQEKQTIVLLQAEMEGLRVRLEEIQRIPPRSPNEEKKLFFCILTVRSCHRLLGEHVQIFLQKLTVRIGKEKIISLVPNRKRSCPFFAKKQGSCHNF
jgi:hypothetical protein